MVSSLRWTEKLALELGKKIGFTSPSGTLFQIALSECVCVQSQRDAILDSEANELKPWIAII